MEALRNTSANFKQKIRDKINFRLTAGVFLAVFLTGAIWFGISDLSIHARVAFTTFSLAVIGWVFTKINETYIALAAALVFTLSGIDEPEEFFETLGDSTIWLLLASFIVAAGITASGLTNRLTLSLARRAKSVSQLFYLLAGALILSAFVIPSTSGRAALMLPIFISLAAVIKDERIIKALSLLFPAIILLSAIASLIGAGAHIVTAEILHKMGGEHIGFAEWLMLGLPFAIISCLISVIAILHIFLNREERRRGLAFAPEDFAANDSSGKEATQDSSKTGLSSSEIYVLGVVGLLILFWTTESLHGINNTIVALVGALAVTMPRFGVIGLKEGIKSINWNILLFMAATLELGEALIESKGAEWLVQKFFYVLQSEWTNSAFFVVTVVALVSLLSHLVINSRTARSSVIIPLVVLLAVSLGFNPTTLAFLSTAAAGFCLTLTVSAKPVAMFSQIEGMPTYSSKDLLRLSSVLLPAHLCLLVVFSFFVWPGMGLTLKHQTPETSPPVPVWAEERSEYALAGSASPTATPWAIFGENGHRKKRSAQTYVSQPRRNRSQTESQTRSLQPESESRLRGLQPKSESQSQSLQPQSEPRVQPKKERFLSKLFSPFRKIFKNDSESSKPTQPIPKKPNGPAKERDNTTARRTQ